jgi:hypothetical protein
MVLWVSVGACAGATARAESGVELDPHSRAIAVVTVHAPTGITQSYVRDVFRPQAEKYSYRVLRCLDDMADEAQILRALEDLKISRRNAAPDRVGLLERTAKHGCPSTGNATLFAARISIQIDPAAEQRAAVLTLRNLDDPGDVKTGMISRPRDFPINRLVAEVVEETLKVPAVVPEPDGKPRRTAGWVATGIGASAVLVGVGTGIALLVKKSRLDDGGCSNRQCPESQYDRLDSYNSLRPVSTVAFVVGGVGLATGAVLLLVAPSIGSTRIGLAPEANGLSARVSGSF